MTFYPGRLIGLIVALWITLAALSPIAPAWLVCWSGMVIAYYWPRCFERGD